MKPKIKFEKKQNVELLLKKLSEITVVKDGQISYTAMELTELEWLFLSIIDFGKILHIESKKRILSNTFQHLAISKNYEKDYFLEQLSNEINKHNSKKTKTLFLLITLSVQSLPFRRIIFHNCRINIHGNNFPRKFKQH